MVLITLLLLFQKCIFLYCLKPQVNASNDCSEISSCSHSGELILKIYFFHNASFLKALWLPITQTINICQSHVDY